MHHRGDFTYIGHCGDFYFDCRGLVSLLGELNRAGKGQGFSYRDLSSKVYKILFFGGVARAVALRDESCLVKFAYTCGTVLRNARGGFKITVPINKVNDLGYMLPHAAAQANQSFEAYRVV